MCFNRFNVRLLSHAKTVNYFIDSNFKYFIIIIFNVDLKISQNHTRGRD